MKKSNGTLDLVEPTRDFYRPHKRVYQALDLVNHKTGEVYTPARRVKQSFVAECDINNILKHYSTTGQVRHMSAKAAMGAYQDLPDSMDYQEALHTVRDSQASFATLPSQVRDRFGNDPSQFLEFMSNPANQDEIIKLGLAMDKRPKQEPPPPSMPPQQNDDKKAVEK